MTLLIILANAVVHVLLVQQSPVVRAEIGAKYGFVPKRIAQLQDPNVQVEVDITPVEQRGQGGPKKIVQLDPGAGAIFVSLLTCMFLHAGWEHLIFNLWGLWIFGNNIEDRLGHFIFLFFYLVAGLLASACQWFVDPSSAIPVVGASGAIAGVLGAYAITFPKARVKTLIFVLIIMIVDLPALLVLSVWFGIQLIHGLAGGAGVAWWAHMGGFVAGLLLMPFMAAGAPDPGTHWDDEEDREFHYG